MNVKNFSQYSKKLDEGIVLSTQYKEVMKETRKGIFNFNDSIDCVL